ncbi:hypothetical protein PCE1_004826 [Barthelona sp. PCE]
MIQIVATTPFEGQKPGTSGLRKKTAVFMQDHYVENFIQSLFDSLDPESYSGTVILSGDGRYYSEECVARVIAVGFANGVKRFLVGEDCLLSTPAVSYMIRSIEDCKLGILLTASHNPGGPENDFGIKFNPENGGPAASILTDSVYEKTKTITEYKKIDLFEYDLSTVGVYGTDDHILEVTSNTLMYVEYMKTLFDFGLLRQRIASGMNFLFDAMHGVTGPYAVEIFHKELGLPMEYLLRCNPLPDFGGCHPDPNKTYAADLVEMMESESAPVLGFASDGDGDRNMVLGKKFFVSPGDSAAVIVAKSALIPQFQAKPLAGVARSMPTSAAVDAVAEKLDIPSYFVPTGWKYFVNLMESGKIDFCCEESFGTSSSHVREKDGIWAVMCWLTIIANDPEASVEEVMIKHWREFGRNVFTRYDYEHVESEKANDFITRLRSFIGRENEGFVIEEYRYVDQIDGSVAEKQGIIIRTSEFRIVFRLSGTGSSGATIRMYIERILSNTNAMLADPTAELLKPAIEFALDVTELHQYTPHPYPTVIT